MPTNPLDITTCGFKTPPNSHSVATLGYFTPDDSGSFEIPDFKSNLLLSLLPNGRAWNKSPLSFIFKFCSVFEKELHRAHARTLNLISELDPETATETLDQWEIKNGLQPAHVHSIEARRSNIAKWESLQGAGSLSLPHLYEMMQYFTDYNTYPNIVSPFIKFTPHVYKGWICNVSKVGVDLFFDETSEKNQMTVRVSGTKVVANKKFLEPIIRRFIHTCVTLEWQDAITITHTYTYRVKAVGDSTESAWAEGEFKMVKTN